MIRFIECLSGIRQEQKFSLFLNFDFYQIRKIYWLAQEPMASYPQLCPIELISLVHKVIRAICVNVSIP
jgi:hypothetical protein